jgi:hypothetical protein
MAEIAVPDVRRDPAFLTSPAFAEAAAAARRVLSAQLVAA